MQKEELPVDFILQMQSVLNEKEIPFFISALNHSDPVTGIRINKVKGKHLNISGNPVPWTLTGLTLEKRPPFTLDPSFHAGAYYVQDPSSMLVDWLARHLLQKVKNPFLLDLAAAPGGKSTILAEIAFEKNGFLLANEVIKSRVPILRQNLARWGYSNIFISSFEIPVFKTLPPLFDLVLLDAPCSGEGLFRKDQNARMEWSTDHVNHCAARQKRILAPIPGLIREGGYLLYSTCTYNTKENDDQISWLCQHFPLKVVSIELPSEWGIIKTDKGGFQCYPHKVNGEGFYIAVLQHSGHLMSVESEVHQKKNQKSSRRKINFPDAISNFINADSDLIGVQDHSGNYYGIPENIFPDFNLISQYLPFIDPLLLLGNTKGKDFIPEAEFALSHYVKDTLYTWDLDRYEALIYLKKEISPLKPMHPGWGRISYGGLPLGWYKAVGDRYNNYFPKHWRIQMPIPEKSSLPPLPFSFKEKKV